MYMVVCGRWGGDGFYEVPGRPAGINCGLQCSCFYLGLKACLVEVALLLLVLLDKTGRKIKIHTQYS